MPKFYKEVDVKGTKLGVEPGLVESPVSPARNFVTGIWQIDDGKHQAGLPPGRKRTLLLAPFSEAHVKLNDDYLEKIKKERQAGGMLAKGDVKLDDRGYMHGTWNSIYEAGQSLVQYFYRSDQNGYDQGGSDPSVIVATPVKDDQAGKENPSTSGMQPTDTVLVQSLLFRYIITYHHPIYQKLENFCQEIRFKMNSKNEKVLTLYPRLDVNKALFDDALEKFITFYQKQSEKMYQEIKSVTLRISTELIAETCSKFSVIIDLSEESKTLTIYGVKAKVHEALQFLSSKFGSFNNVSSKAAPTSGFPTAPNERYSCQLFNILKLTVYQGDLTKEKVDVIVNPANERLEHCGGAAEAIAKAGGRTIQTQSNDIMRKRRKQLVAGEVEVTAAGMLPCKFIVHAVGPRRSEHNGESAKKCLLAAVVNSLKAASKNKAQSIAIPAISSGVFGIPVDFCARVLFDAAETFVKDKHMVSQLQEIRFVNIDPATNEVFVKEMMKRYSSNVKKEVKVESSLLPAEMRRKTTAEDAERQISIMKKNSLTSDPSLVSNEKDQHTNSKGSSDENCAICLSKLTKKKTLDKCGHSFCTACIDQAFQHQKKCPVCSQVYGPLIGNQPPGKMIVSHSSLCLSGFEPFGAIQITYKFEGGVQGPDHPNPGKRYNGTQRTAYLPDNKEGNKVLKLLQKAFAQKLTFTIGRSSTSGASGVITWNDIHHKTRMMGGPTNFGYPDSGYLKRVQEELAAKGITE